jgi:hypothetical protein
MCFLRADRELPHASAAVVADHPPESEMEIEMERHAGYLVTLDRDIRGEDAEEILAAIKMIKFVAKVEPVEGDMVLESITEHRVNRKWQDALLRTMEHVTKRADDPLAPRGL